MLKPERPPTQQDHVLIRRQPREDTEAEGERRVRTEAETRSQDRDRTSRGEPEQQMPGAERAWNRPSLTAQQEPTL